MKTDNESPVISIIVPVYKSEKYLEDCVRSILRQTFGDFELLLIDDGSPDTSGELCEKLTQTDSRIRVYHKENGGASSARNFGMEHALGTYIMFCDSDDYVMPEWIEKLYDLIESDEVDLGICGMRAVSGSDCLVGGSETLDTEVLEKTEFWNLYMDNLMKSACNKIYIKEIIWTNHIQFREGQRIAEDQLFNYRYLSLMKNKIGLCRTAMYAYRCNAESATHRYVKDMWTIEKDVENVLKNTIAQCGIDFNLVSSQYYEMYIDAIDWCLRNNMRSGSGIPFRKRFLENCKILRSKECKTAMKNGVFPPMNPVYKLCLRTRFYPLVWLFQVIV